MCVCLEGKKESSKVEKQKFSGKQKDTDLINLTDVYLLHCFVFRNLSQNTSISSSYHQHLEMRGRGGGVKRKVGREEEERKWSNGTQ